MEVSNEKVFNTNSTETNTFLFQDLVVKSSLESLLSESIGCVCGVETDIIHKGNRYFYPVNTRSTAVEMFQALVEKYLKDLRMETTTVSTCFSLALKSLSSRPDVVIQEQEQTKVVLLWCLLQKITI